MASSSGFELTVKRAGVLALLGLIFAAPASGTSGQGLYGLVTRSPTKPVCSSDEPCSEPAAGIKLRFLRRTTWVATAVTDARGRYRLRLPRGLYSVRVAGARPIGAGVQPTSVRVRASWRRQNFDIDTGIR